MWNPFKRPPQPPAIQPMAKLQRITPGTLAALVGIPVAIALGVFIPQEESGRRTEASVNADGALVVKHIAGKQYLRAYLDAVGVATACDGLTRWKGKPIRITDQFAEEECGAMLEVALVEHAGPVMKCTPGIALSDNPAIEKSREGPRFTAVSLGYNVGTGAYCQSTAARRFNAGNYAGGCDAATWWVRGGKRVLPGLVKRRTLENNVCLNGLTANFRR